MKADIYYKDLKRCAGPTDSPKKVPVKSEGTGPAAHCSHQHLVNSLKAPAICSGLEVQSARILGAPWVVGILLGIAAGTVGVKLGIGPLRISALITMVAAIAAVAGAGVERVLRYRPTRIELASGALVIVGIALELYNSISVGHEARLDMSVQWLIYMLGFFAARLVIRDRNDTVALLRGLIFFAPVFAIAGILQTLNFPPVVHAILDITQSSSAIGRYERNEYTRATGLVGHWTGFGSYLLTMTLALFALSIVVRRSGSRGIRLFHIRTLVFGLAILCTLTMSSIIAFFILTLIYLWQSKRLGIFGGLVFGSVGVASTAIGDLLQRRLTDQFGYNPGAKAESNGLIPETLAYRLDIWSNQTIPAIEQRPFTGWGQGFYQDFGRWLDFPSYMTWQSAESQWLLALIQSGIIGLALLAIVIAQMFHGFTRQEQDLKYILLAFITLCLLTSFTVPQFTNAGLPAGLLVLCALFNERILSTEVAIKKPH
jgi:hypothetical protein